MTGDNPMVELHSPDSEPQLLVLRSVLDDAGIPYFVDNETFGSLLAGPRIAHYNRKRILVHRTDLDEARALLAEFLDKTADAPNRETASDYPLSEKLRMVFEFLIFGWFLPGRRPRRSPELRLVRGWRTRQKDPPGPRKSK